MKREEINNLLKAQLPMLKEKYHVKNIGLFGSVARGEENEKSDIDLLVEFESPIGFFGFIRLENFLSEQLRGKVDLVTRGALKPAIKDIVLKETIYA